MLEKTINESLKKALKEKNVVGVSVLRLMISEVKNHKIANKIKEELPDDDVMAVLQKMAKRYRESIESFEKGSRSDLVQKETEELEFLSSFLPRPLSDDEVDNVVETVIRDTGASSMKDLPVVMKEVMSRVSGRSDGRVVSGKVREKLGGL